MKSTEPDVSPATRNLAIFWFGSELPTTRQRCDQWSENDAVTAMSPELETLDQLLGSDLSLGIVLRLYSDATAFKRGVHALLASGDVCLLTTDEGEVPTWRCREFVHRWNRDATVGADEIENHASGCSSDQMRCLRERVTGHRRFESKKLPGCP